MGAPDTQLPLELFTKTIVFYNQVLFLALRGSHLGGVVSTARLLCKNNEYLVNSFYFYYYFWLKIVSVYRPLIYCRNTHSTMLIPLSFCSTFTWVPSTLCVRRPRSCLHNKPHNQTCIYVTVIQLQTTQPRTLPTWSITQWDRILNLVGLVVFHVSLNLAVSGCALYVTLSLLFADRVAIIKLPICKYRYLSFDYTVIYDLDRQMAWILAACDQVLPQGPDLTLGHVKSFTCVTLPSHLYIRYRQMKLNIHILDIVFACKYILLTCYVFDTRDTVCSSSTATVKPSIKTYRKYELGIFICCGGNALNQLFFAIVS